mgnify:CR=1 FL=1
MDQIALSSSRQRRNSNIYISNVSPTSSQSHFLSTNRAKVREGIVSYNYELISHDALYISERPCFIPKDKL